MLSNAFKSILIMIYFGHRCLTCTLYHQLSSGTWISRQQLLNFQHRQIYCRYWSVAGIDLLPIKLFDLYIVLCTPSIATTAKFQTQNNKFRHRSVMDVAVWIVHYSMYSVNIGTGVWPTIFRSKLHCSRSLLSWAFSHRKPTRLSVITPGAPHAFQLRRHPSEGWSIAVLFFSVFQITIAEIIKLCHYLSEVWSRRKKEFLIWEAVKLEA